MNTFSQLFKNVKFRILSFVLLFGLLIINTNGLIAQQDPDSTSPTAQPQTLLLEPIADGHVGYLFTTDEDFWEGSGFSETIMFGIDFPGSMVGFNYRPLLKFDLSQIPEGSIIQNAELRLAPKSSGGPTIDFRTYRLSNDWTETLIDAGGFDPFSNEDPFLESTLTEFGGYSNFNITQFVNDWVNNGVPNFGVELVPVDVRNPSLGVRELNASENGNGLSSELLVQYLDPSQLDQIPNEVAVVRNGNIWLVSLDGSRPDEQITFEGRDVQIAWANDGLAMFFTRSKEENPFSYTIWSYSFLSGTEEELPIPQNDISSGILLTSDGEDLIFAFEQPLPPSQAAVSVIGTESCIARYGINSQQVQIIRCHPDLFINPTDINESNSQIVAGISGFEFALLGTISLQNGAILNEVPYIGGIFNEQDSAIYSGRIFCYFCGDQPPANGFGIRLVNLGSGAETNFFRTEENVNVLELDGTIRRLLYADSNGINLLDLSSNSSQFLSPGTHAKFRPFTQIQLPIGFEEWLAEKDELIQDLESPDIYIFNGEQPMPGGLIPGWGYNENEASAILKELEANFERFNEGSMTLEEQEVFIQKVEAFGRLYLTERAISRIYSNFSETAFKFSETATRLIATSIGFTKAINAARTKAIAEDERLLLPILQISARAARGMTNVTNQIFDRTIERVDDPELRNDLQLQLELLTTAADTYILDTDPDWGSFIDIADIALNPIISGGVSKYYYIDGTQHLIDEGVERIETADSGDGVEGTFLNATQQMEGIVSDTNIVQDRMNLLHADFDEAIYYTELTSALADLATLSGGGAVIAAPVGIVSDGFTIILNSYDGYCLVSHMKYLRNATEEAYQLIYFPPSVFAIEPLPDFCDFSWWPSWLNWPPTFGEGSIDARLASTSHYPAASNRTRLSTTIAGDAIVEYSEALEQLQANVVVADLDSLSSNLVDLIAAEDALLLELQILEGTTLPIDIDENSWQLHRGVVELNLKIASFYTSLLYLYNQPENELIRGQALNQMVSITETLDSLSQLDIAVASPQDSDATTNSTIIASTKYDGYYELGTPLSIDVTLANLSDNDLENAIIEIRNDGKIVASANVDFVPGAGRQIVSLSADLVDMEQQIIIINLLSEDNEKIDSEMIFIAVEPEGFITNRDIDDQLNEDDGLMDDAENDLQSPDETVTDSDLDSSNVIQPNESQTSNLLWLSAVFLVALVGGIGGTVYLNRQGQRRLALFVGGGGAIIILIVGFLIARNMQSAPSTDASSLATDSNNQSIIIEPTLSSTPSLDGTMVAQTAVSLLALVPTETPTSTPTITPSPTPTITPTPSPTSVTTTFGQSVNGVPLTYYTLGNGDRAIIIVGGIHAGTAPSSVTVPEELAQYFLANESSIPENIKLYIISTLNPDARSAPGDIAGRFNANGVDLNRNWDCRWQANTNVFGQDVTGAGGNEPHSEPESQALIQLVESVGPELIIFYEARASNGLVAPGGCGVRHTPSEDFSMQYANGSGFRLYNFDDIVADTITGDASNYFTQMGVPAIFVILPEYESVILEPNLAGLRAIMNGLNE